MLPGDIIQLTLLIVTALSSIASFKTAISTLKQNAEMIENSTKPNIVFYVDYNPENNRYKLIIENFGNSIGIIKYIKITPKLDWKKTIAQDNSGIFTDSDELMLAPKQKIESCFYFDNYPDKIFDIEIKYLYPAKNNAEYINKYKINLNFVKNTVWLTEK